MRRPIATAHLDSTEGGHDEANARPSGAAAAVAVTALLVGGGIAGAVIPDSQRHRPRLRAEQEGGAVPDRSGCRSELWQDLPLDWNEPARRDEGAAGLAGASREPGRRRHLGLRAEHDQESTNGSGTARPSRGSGTIHACYNAADKSVRVYDSAAAKGKARRPSAGTRGRIRLAGASGTRSRRPPASRPPAHLRGDVTGQAFADPQIGASSKSSPAHRTKALYSTFHWDFFQDPMPPADVESFPISDDYGGARSVRAASRRGSTCSSRHLRDARTENREGTAPGSTALRASRKVTRASRGGGR